MYGRIPYQGRNLLFRPILKRESPTFASNLSICPDLNYLVPKSVKK